MTNLPERLVDRIEASTIPVSVADPNREGQPLIIVNRAFEKLTGYARDEVIGRNCRFLQGPETERAVCREIAAALSVGRDISCKIQNYTKSGKQFENMLIIRTVNDAMGKPALILGFQFEWCDALSVEARRRNLDMDHDLQHSYFLAVDTARRSIDASRRQLADMLYHLAVRLIRGYGHHGVLHERPELRSLLGPASIDQRQAEPAP